MPQPNLNASKVHRGAAVPPADYHRRRASGRWFFGACRAAPRRTDEAGRLSPNRARRSRQAVDPLPPDGHPLPVQRAAGGRRAGTWARPASRPSRPSERSARIPRTGPCSFGPARRSAPRSGGPGRDLGGAARGNSNCWLRRPGRRRPRQGLPLAEHTVNARVTGPVGDGWVVERLPEGDERLAVRAGGNHGVSPARDGRGRACLLRAAKWRPMPACAGPRRGCRLRSWPKTMVVPDRRGRLLDTRPSAGGESVRFRYAGVK
jgi:hypothetical protein